jgi:uncharacterized membrane protein YjjP (DUF1212 family)
VRAPEISRPHAGKLTATAEMLQATQSIQLPPWLLAHAFGLCALGFYFLMRGTPWNNNATRGIATFALGVAYLATGYMPPEQNQFLAASVPVRMAIGGIAAAAAILGKGDRKTLIGVALYDGVGGWLVGQWLGNFSGRVALEATR